MPSRMGARELGDVPDGLVEQSLRSRGPRLLVLLHLARVVSKHFPVGGPPRRKGFLSREAGSSRVRSVSTAQPPLCTDEQVVGEACLSLTAVEGAACIGRFTGTEGK